MARLADIMTRDVFTAASDAPVAEVARSMVKGRFGSVLVTQSSMLVGIFTERDVLRAAASGADLTESPIADWMTKDPETAAPDTDSEDAAEMMLARGFRHLPVMEGNAVAGVVSLRDVLSTRVRRAPG
ncbi:MAG: CBS domain-containing protein [Actinobacteria bacterium]|nr:CBS domain-containing protein [Actinomycetota bacterium]